MRCPACGARNAGRAAWCTQCFAPLGTTPEPDVAPGADEAPGVDDAPRADEAPGADGGPGPDRDVRVRGEEVEWRCGTCDAWNPLAVAACSVCSAPRYGFGEAVDDGRRPADLRVVVGASMLLPGAGHVVAGRRLAGAVRGVLALVWVVGGIALWRAAAGAGAAPTAGVALVVGAVALWAGTVVDASRLARGRPEPFGTRSVLVLTVVVVGVLLVALALGVGGPGAVR